MDNRNPSVFSQPTRATICTRSTNEVLDLLESVQERYDQELEWAAHAACAMATDRSRAIANGLVAA